MSSPQKILFATNYSELSSEALEVATQLARAKSALLMIVHVSELEPFPVGESVRVDASPDPNELQRLQTVLPTDTSVNYEHHLLYGEAGSAEITQPAKVIVEFAKDQDVDMIVVATHGRRGLAYLLMGDVAEDIIRTAPCPVVAVRHHVEQEAMLARS
ncbi:MAG: universal stress protein [Planctomycetales bacterium]|nr:universal stress protein [Planctomycetales bacterium]